MLALPKGAPAVLPLRARSVSSRMSDIIPLAQASRANVHLVGAKAAVLGELLTAGFPVPDGFVITTSAYRRCAGVTLTAMLLDGAQRAMASAGLKHVAVRSSAVDEDGPARSFAGQYTTVYGVVPGTLATAVADCWASARSAQVATYRAFRKDSCEGSSEENGEENGEIEAGAAAADAQPPLAVIVQRMLKADRSGVCFTRHPAYPSDAAAAAPDVPLLIEACWGLGAALVDGRVSPDQFLIDEKLRLRDQRIARKRHRVTLAADATSADRWDPVPLAMQNQSTLTGEEARQVARLALRARARFEAHQDVEWAFEHGRLYLLQSRPVTTELRVTRQETAESAERYVRYKPLSENFSEGLSPLTQDLTRRILPPMGRFSQGQLQLDTRVLRWLLPLRLSEDQFRNLLELRELPEKVPLDWRRVPVTACLGIVAYLSYGVFWYRSAHVTARMLARFEALCERVAQDPTVDALRALRRLLLGLRPFQPLGHYAFQLNISSGRYFLLLGCLRWLLHRWAPTLTAPEISALCTSTGRMASRDLVLDLRRLGRLLATAPELDKQVRGGNTAAALAQLDALPADHGFAIAFTRFLARFGHRGERELDLLAPRWREQPGNVLALLRNYAGEQRPEPAVDLRGQHLAARDRLRKAVKGRWQRSVLTLLLRRIEYFVALRENTRHYHTMAFAVVRDKLLALEQTLLENGTLRCRDDIFFLTWSEVQSLVHGAPWDTVAASVRKRQQGYRAAQRTPQQSMVAATGRVLRGQCASPGTAEGRARVIRDPVTDPPLEPGDILVAPYTDPTWTVLFPAAAAIVVEIGSYLSHAGTVAREFQVPCLVDVAACTTSISNGDRLRVDADRGEVTILK